MIFNQQPNPVTENMSHRDRVQCTCMYYHSYAHSVEPSLFSCLCFSIMSQPDDEPQVALRVELLNHRLEAILYESCSPHCSKNIFYATKKQVT